jgi:hypothetical protein
MEIGTWMGWRVFSKVERNILLRNNTGPFVVVRFYIAGFITYVGVEQLYMLLFKRIFSLYVVT